MAKSTKLTENELKSLQENVNKINQVYMELGRLENQKHKILHNMEELDNDFAELQKEIEDKYGKVSVNIEDGVLSEIPENDAK
jgi:predicted transcriptional regulator